MKVLGFCLGTVMFEVHKTLRGIFYGRLLENVSSHDSERPEMLGGSLSVLPAFSKASYREDHEGREAVGGQRASMRLWLLVLLILPGPLRPGLADLGLDLGNGKSGH